MSPFVFGSSLVMKELERKVHSIAGSNLPVLIEGESGAGKTALAEHIHFLSGKPGEFVGFHCGRADAEAAATRLFREVEPEGARLRRPLPGTLFLHNVNLLNHLLQQRLLAAMRGGLGLDGATNGHPPVRLICSSCESLEHWVAREQFLPDLYFRLAVCRLPLPPLRQRARDVPELFLTLAQWAQPAGAQPGPPLSSRLLDALMSYSWPGNVRELQNLARNHTLAPDAEALVAELLRRSKTLNLAAEHAGEALPLRDQVRRASKQLESEIILRTLERHRWNRRRTAQTLKISYRALLYKMKDCNLRSETGARSEEV